MVLKVHGKVEKDRESSLGHNKGMEFHFMKAKREMREYHFERGHTNKCPNPS
jgi:hypothetical protein